MRRAIKYLLQLIILVLVFMLGVVTSDSVREIFRFVDDATTSISGAITNNTTSQFTTSTGDRARADIEAHFGIDFPNAIRDVYYAQVDDDVWIRFIAPVSALQGLFRGSSLVTCSAPLTVNYMPMFDFDQNVPLTVRDSVTWWNVREVRQYSGSQCQGQNRAFRLLADQSNPQTWLVYVEVVEN